MKKWKKLYGLSATFLCPYCQKVFSMVEATKEHEPPQSRQKEFGKSEVIWACKKCNNEKGSLTAQEYAEWKRLEFIRNGGLSNQRR